MSAQPAPVLPTFAAPVSTSTQPPPNRDLSCNSTSPAIQTQPHSGPPTPFFSRVRRAWAKASRHRWFWISFTIIFLLVAGKDIWLGSLEEGGKELQLLLQTYPHSNCATPPDGRGGNDSEGAGTDMAVIGQDNCVVFDRRFESLQWTWVSPPSSVTSGAGAQGIQRYFECWMELYSNFDCLGEPDRRIQKIISPQSLRSCHNGSESAGEMRSVLVSCPPLVRGKW